MREPVPGPLSCLHLHLHRSRPAFHFFLLFVQPPSDRPSIIQHSQATPPVKSAAVSLSTQ